MFPMQYEQDKNSMCELGDRIRAVRGKASQEAFAKKVGVHKNTLNRYEKGERVPDAQFLAGMCRRFPDINPAWLLMGWEPRYTLAVAEGQEPYVAPFAGGNSVVIGGDPVVLNDGTEVVSDQILHGIAFNADWVANRLGRDPAQLIAIEVRGDAMDDTLQDGDLLLVDVTAREIGEGGVFVVHDDNALHVRRLRRLYDGAMRVTTENKAYPDQVVPAANIARLRVVGQVLWYGRRF